MKSLITIHSPSEVKRVGYTIEYSDEEAMIRILHTELFMRFFSDVHIMNK